MLFPKPASECECFPVLPLTCSAPLGNAYEGGGILEKPQRWGKGERDKGPPPGRNLVATYGIPVRNSPIALRQRVLRPSDTNYAIPFSKGRPGSSPNRLKAYQKPKKEGAKQS